MNVDTARGTLRSEQFLSQLREIDRVNPVRQPIMMPGDRIELAPVGYCPHSHVYTLENDIHYDEDMSLNDAVAIICDILSKFPFHDRGRSLAVQVAAMLTVFAVGLLPRTASRPGFIYTANDSDAGKTLLAKVAIIPVLGEVNVRAFPRREESRKALDQIAMDGEVIVLFDNVKGTLGGETMEAFISAPRWGGRVIGEKGGFKLDNVTTCFFTGNDAHPTRGMEERCLFIELFLRQLDSSKRNIRRILNNRILAEPALRCDICSALWAFVRHWDAAGRPKFATSMPKCPEWSERIASIVVAAGFGDPCAKPAIASATGDILDMQKLVGALARGQDKRYEDTFPEMMKKAKELSLFESRTVKNRKDGIEEFYTSQGKLTPFARSHFGMLFRNYSGRLFTGEDGGCLKFTVEGPKDNRRYVVTREGHREAAFA
jgi:hypothetical protein